MLDDSRRVIVDIKGVAKQSGERDARVGALRTLDLTAHAGGMVAPPGSSGSGKTALLNIIGCIIDPSDGQDNLDSEMINDNRWLRGDLRDWADDLLAVDRLRRDGVFDAEPVHALWERFGGGERKWHTHLWNVLMFQAWHQHWRAERAAMARP